MDSDVFFEKKQGVGYGPYVFSGGQRVHKKMRQKKQGRWKGKGGRRVADGRLLGCIVIFPSLQPKK